MAKRVKKPPVKKPIKVKAPQMPSHKKMFGC